MTEEVALATASMESEGAKNVSRRNRAYPNTTFSCEFAFANGRSVCTRAKRVLRF